MIEFNPNSSIAVLINDGSKAVDAYEDGDTNVVGQVIRYQQAICHLNHALFKCNQDASVIIDTIGVGNMNTLLDSFDEKTMIAIERSLNEHNLTIKYTRSWKALRMRSKHLGIIYIPKRSDLKARVELLKAFADGGVVMIHSGVPKNHQHLHQPIITMGDEQLRACTFMCEQFAFDDIKQYEVKLTGSNRILEVRCVEK